MCAHNSANLVAVTVRFKQLWKHKIIRNVPLCIFVGMLSDAKSCQNIKLWEMFYQIFVLVYRKCSITYLCWYTFRSKQLPQQSLWTEQIWNHAIVRNVQSNIFVGVFSDVNECDNSPCEQVCENSPGSYRCLCNKGFSFNADTGKCEGEIVTVWELPW